MKTNTAITITLITAFFLLISCSPQPQVRRLLVLTYPTAEQTLGSFKRGMESLGYREGRDIIYLIATAQEGDELRAKAQSLMQNKPEAIVSLTSWATTVAIDLNRERNLPHIFGQVSTLAGIGMDSEEERVKGNITGITSTIPITKQLEYLKRFAPGARRVLVVYKPEPLPLSIILSLRSAAPAMKIDLIEKQTQDLDHLTKVLQDLKPGEVDALLQVPDSIGSFNVPILTQAALRLKVPLSVTLGQSAFRNGALFAYVPSLDQHGVEVANLADKVLKGIPPSRLPVEIPKSYHLTINLETAREIGLTIPQEMLSLADRLVSENELAR